MTKKSLIILLLVVILPTLLALGYFAKNSGNQKKTEVCKDSDAGSDYFIKGYITYPVYKKGSKEDSFIEKWEDECLRKINPGEPKPVNYYSTKTPDGKIEIYERSDCSGSNCYVKEAVCTLKHVEYYLCPNGCKDGACIK